MASRSPRRSRPIEIGRAAWGAGLLFAPRLMLERVHHARIDRASLIVARILGARQLTQAALSGLRPSPEVLAMGVWVDSVHALSAVGLAVADRSRARAGLTDTAAACVWAGAGYRDLLVDAPTPPRHQHLRDRLAVTVLRIVPGGRGLLHRAQTDRRSA